MKKINFLAPILLACQSPPHIEDQKEHAIVRLDPITVESPAHISPSRQELLVPLFRAMIQEEQGEFPFDEPRHENGRQLDGRLRPMWEQAYFGGKKKYALEADIYHTIDASDNNLIIPQVCVDFIVDSIDYAAGTHYNADLNHPARILGKFDFRDQIKQAGFDPRNVDSFLEYLHTRPNDFQFIFEGEGPESVGEVGSLKDWFQNQGVQIGDLILIKGRAPWDRGAAVHFHSFFITRLDSDKKVAMIMGNPAFPVEWSLENEVRRAPKRKVIAIIRLTDSFLSVLQK